LGAVQRVAGLNAKDLPNQKASRPIEDNAHAGNAKARGSHAVKAGRMSTAQKMQD